MTQEDKNILLQDLCNRLPYGVKCQIPDKYGGYTSVIENIDITGYIVDSEGNLTEIELVRPYLFPLSSMTEEQKQEYTYIVNYISSDDTENWKEGEFIYVEQFTQLMHFYHTNHLDYRGLIPMGLANDATGLNIY